MLESFILLGQLRCTPTDDTEAAISRTVVHKLDRPFCLLVLLLQVLFLCFCLIIAINLIENIIIGMGAANSVLLCPASLVSDY